MSRNVRDGTASTITHTTRQAAIAERGSRVSHEPSGRGRPAAIRLSIIGHHTSTSGGSAPTRPR